MLKPAYIKGTPDIIIEQWRILEDSITGDIARRIKKTGEFTGTADLQARVLYEAGQGAKETREKILRFLDITAEELDTIIYESGRMTYDDDRYMYSKFGGFNLPKFDDSPFAKNIVDAVALQAQKDLRSISKSIGFVHGKKPMGVDDYFKRTLNTASFQVASGAFDADSIARRFIRELGATGVRVINFDSGQTRELESHLRYVVNDAVSQLSNNLGKRNAEELEWDLMEVSSHSGARPSHASWQGEIVSLSGKRGYLSQSDIGVGEITGFGGANCNHSWYPYFEGSDRGRDEEEKEAIDDEPVAYNGKTYTKYEAFQRQRAIERSIRKSKRKLIGFQAAEDKKAFTTEAVRLSRKRQEYKSFSRQTGIKADQQSLMAYNYNRSIASRAAWANRKA